jgi:hypothetical protein
LYALLDIREMPFVVCSVSPMGPCRLLFSKKVVHIYERRKLA